MSQSRFGVNLGLTSSGLSVTISERMPNGDMQAIEQHIFNDLTDLVRFARAIIIHYGGSVHETSSINSDPELHADGVRETETSSER